MEEEVVANKQQNKYDCENFESLNGFNRVCTAICVVLPWKCVIFFTEISGDRTNLASIFFFRGDP